VSNFASTLIQWHGKHGRSGLPWQGQKDPYRVWLSEIMLQQTQVSTVKDRYIEFINTFPTVDDLANASVDEVMALWAGLGYYTRARNLHACAKIIVEKFAGKFPQQAEELCLLPGIGMSTAAAIASFCFGEKISILDANVKRLLARLYGVEQDIKKTILHQELWEKAQHLVPKEAADMPIYTQALMDFGATVCTPKNPHCTSCVFQKKCIAFRENKVGDIPLRVKKVSIKTVQSEMLFILATDHALFERRPGKGIWGGLWSFPESAWQESPNQNIQPLQLSMDDFIDLPKQLLKSSYAQARVLAPRKHVFTHRNLYFQIRILTIEQPLELPKDQFAWVKIDACDHLGLPTPIRQFLKDYLQP